MANDFDLYQQTGSIGGVYKGNTVALTLGSSGGEGGLKGSLVQNIALQYQRDVNRIWELGSTDTYYIIGRSMGNASLNRIVAKRGEDVLDALSDACTAINKTLTLTAAANACKNNDSSNLTLKMVGPILVSRSYSVDVQQFVMTSNATLMFANLQKA